MSCSKFIFLDVDGVLNADLTTTQMTKNGYTFVEDQFLERLKRIVDETGAHIVLSSDWRFDAPSGSDYIELFNALADHGLEIASMTGDYEWRGRGAEIYQWFYTFHNKYSNELVQYVILDDLTKFDFYEMQWPHFVQTNALHGLQDEDVEKAIEILSMPGEEVPGEIV